MGLSELQSFYNSHCRFKLRSGREVFGVIWTVGSTEGDRLVFASVQDYKRAMSGVVDKSHLVDLGPDEIVWAQRLVG